MFIISYCIRAGDPVGKVVEGVIEVAGLDLLDEAHEHRLLRGGRQIYIYIYTYIYI